MVGWGIVDANIYENPKLWSPLYHFLGQQLTTHHRDVVLSSCGIFDDDFRIDMPSTWLEEKQSSSESHFFIVDVAIGFCSLLAWSKTCCSAFLRSSCAPRSQLRIHGNISWVVSRCLRRPSGALDAFTHKIKSIPLLYGLQRPASICSCKQVKCRRSAGAVFVFSFRAPQTSTNSDHWSTPKSRCRPLCWERAGDRFREERQLLWRISSKSLSLSVKQEPDETKGAKTATLFFCSYKTYTR